MWNSPTSLKAFSLSGPSLGNSDPNVFNSASVASNLFTTASFISGREFCKMRIIQRYKNLSFTTSLSQETNLKEIVFFTLIFKTNSSFNFLDKFLEPRSSLFSWLKKHKYKKIKREKKLIKRNRKVGQQITVKFMRNLGLVYHFRNPPAISPPSQIP